MNFLKHILASIIGFIIGTGLVFLLFFIIISGIIGNLSKKPSVKENTVLELKLNGAIPERMAEDPFAALGQGGAQEMNPTVGLDKIISGLDRAAKDSKVKGIIIRADLYTGGLATADEIRNRIIAFRKSGKFVYAYAEMLTDGGYFIASACDKVFLNPKGYIEFNGFSGRVAFFKGMLDKVGVEFEVFKVGKYKGAVEPFVQTSLSEANREQIRAYVNELFGYHIKNIGLSRNIDSGTLAGIANGFLARTAAKALEYKLIDGLMYEDEVEAEVRKKLGLKEEDKFKPMAFASYVKSERDEKYAKDKIAVIYATGDIGMGKNESGEGIGSETIAAAIRKARLDKKVKAVVFRVNSPGGSSNASDIIAREIELCKKVKPVIISFGDVAASGGYYISCMGDSIFAYPNSITGSIGVFALLPNTSKLYKEKLGLAFETVPTGEFASGWRPDQPLSDGMRQYFQEMVNEVYVDFISIVGKGRKMDTALVAKLAQGHVYTAMAAKSLGLVDGYGGIQRAIQSAAWKAKIKDYRIVNYPQLKTPLEMLFGKEGGEEMSSQFIKAELGEFYAPFQQLKNIQSHSGMQMWMPWTITIE